MSIGKLSEYNITSGNWSMYIERTEMYFKVNAVKEDLWLPTLIAAMGDEAYELLSNLTSPEKPSTKTYAAVVKLMGDHLQPKPSFMAERFRFRQRRQNPGESVIQYISELKKMSRFCDFGTVLEENMRDQLVCGLRSEVIRQRLFAEDSLQYAKAVKISSAMEAAERDAAAVEQTSGGCGGSSVGVADSVHAVHVAMRNSRGRRGRGGLRGSAAVRGRRDKEVNNDCAACGSTDHKSDECRYNRFICGRCGQRGHLRRVCPARSGGIFRGKELPTNSMVARCTDDRAHLPEVPGEYEPPLSDDEIEPVVEDLHQLSLNSYKPVSLKICIDGIVLPMEIDTGSLVSCISKNTYDKFFKCRHLQKSQMLFKFYNGTTIRPLGVIMPLVKYRNISKIVELFVIEGGTTSLLGRQWLSEFNIRIPLYQNIENINVVNENKNLNHNINVLLDRFKELFSEGLGRFTGGKAQLRVREGATPVFCRARPVPYALRERVEAELAGMLRAGVIEPVDSADWATPLVPVMVWGNNTVAEVVGQPLQEAGIIVAGLPTGPLSAPLPLPLSEPLPLPELTKAPPAALLFLGGSKAPVEPRAPAMSLEGEVLVVEHEPPQWDGKDLEVFLSWEKIYASTLFSALELYGKPLLRAAVITKEEYHILFYYLESVSEASEALTQRMRKYIDSGLIKMNVDKDEDEDPFEIKSQKDDESRSILTELVQEGVLSQQDIDLSSEIANSECNGRCSVANDSKIEDDNRSSVSSIGSSLRKIIVDIPLETCENEIDSSIIESIDNVTTVTIRSSGQCCADHRISADVTENVWSNVRWDFLNPADFGYDQIPSVKRSRSESAITPIVQCKGEEIYEKLHDDEGESCGSMTPYESIEDLYDCIKNSGYSNVEEEISPSIEGHSEPSYPDFYDKASTTRQSSASSDKSGISSAFHFSKCGSSDSTGAYTSCESTSGISSLIPKIIANSLNCRELPPPPDESASNESTILLKQLFMGELMDAYGEYMSAYPYARALLRKKARRDEHFTALADIRRGAAKYTIRDYLELPIERLAQYERLVGGGCARRRAARLSDLERVQDLFPHDYLALHDADAPAALASHHAQKSKSLRKRPSLEIGNVTANTNSLTPRTFIMEAPVQLCPIGSTSPPLDRHLFLFNDLLLVGKSRGTNCFKLKESVRLAEIWLSMPDGDDTGFLIGWPTFTGVTNYLATYPTQAARDTWYRKIQNSLNAQLATEPKSTNIQVFYKDMTSSIEFCKTVSVSPEMSARCVVKQALHVLQTGGEEVDHEPEGEGDEKWGAANDFTLCVRTGRDAPSTPMHGIERPHAIQMSRIRQTLSNEDGFDLEHVNAKNNPCGLVFELRKKNLGLKSASGRGLRLLRRSSGRMFGAALTRLCGGAPPPALLHALRRLRALAPRTHGVFRRSANAKALRLLRDKLDALGPWADARAELDRAPVLLLAALVKEFFRALPQPLLLSELYPAWLQVLGLPQTEKVAAVRSLLLKLPKPHYNMLTYFVCLLQAIAKKSNINLMCPMNLGVCVGPSLLWPSVPCEKALKAVPMIVELLIVKAEALFGPQIVGLLGNGNPESSNALLDSGAEESDSLHSVGISLDSMELSTPRKEKLSLSRDSGLTLSEDDSNSNGGNSPAPRNIIHSMSVPTCNLQPDSKLVPRYGTENHNVNGLPQINQRQKSIYTNKAEIYSTVNEELYTNPYMGERYVHNTINIGLANGIDERNYVSKTAIQRSTADIYGQSPAKYITGLEPQKPPRSNVSKAARTSKVYSMYSEAQDAENVTNKTFNRAKSSDNLLEGKQEVDKRDLVSSQENIVYSNIHDLAMFTENIQRQNQYQTHADMLSNMNYSRVYTGWEKKSANYNTQMASSDKIYGHAKKGETSQSKTDTKTPAATIFTRNDWSRQAARTKSLEVNEDGPGQVADRTRNANYEISVNCKKRRFDPAHMCTNSCREKEKNVNSHNTYAYIDDVYSNSSEENKKTRLRNYNNNKLNQSKSLANIMLQTDSSSSDTLYQPQNSFNGRSTDSPASENSFENCYTTQYIEPLYTSVYNRRRDIFHEEKSAMFASDIYKATPTSVQPEYAEKEPNNNKKPPHVPPPVPPRKMVYQRVLKKFQPVHVKEDKSRSKSVPPVYRDPPNGTEKNGQNGIALECSESDTESESYV